MKLKCSICGTVYSFEYKKEESLPSHFPFCSRRCKGIDLGKWLNEEYYISNPNNELHVLTDSELVIEEEFKEEEFTKLLESELKKI